MTVTVEAGPGGAVMVIGPGLTVTIEAGGGGSVIVEAGGGGSVIVETSGGGSMTAVTGGGRSVIVTAAGVLVTVTVTQFPVVVVVSCVTTQLQALLTLECKPHFDRKIGIPVVKTIT